MSLKSNDVLMTFVSIGPMAILTYLILEKQHSSQLVTDRVSKTITSSTPSSPDSRSVEITTSYIS